LKLPLGRSCVIGLFALSSCRGAELYLENDIVYGGNDQDYTAGMRLQYTYDAAQAPDWVVPVLETINPFRWGRATEVGLTLGQQIFTPVDLEQSQVIDDDRPYAGWLFAGLARYDCEYDTNDSRRRDQQISTEFVAGVLGPPSFAEEVHEFAHEVMDDDEPQGWDNQLDAEPTFMMSMQRQDRVLAAHYEHLHVDLITRLGGSLGTPVTGAFLGTTVRSGWNLPRDFAANPTNPSNSYTAISRRSTQRPSVYFFGGVVGRGVAYSSFLDGNLFTSSHSVDREAWLTDLEYGAAVQLGKLHVALTFVERTPEFRERKEDHAFGSLHLSWTAD
jgi:hypothetical protein